MSEERQIKSDSELVKLKDQIINFEKSANEIIVDSDKSKEAGMSIMSDVKTSLKTLEEKRKDYKKFYLDKCKDIDSFAKTFSEPLNKIFKIVDSKIIEYHNELLKIQKENERKAQEKFEREQLAKKQKLEALQEKLNSGKIGDLDRRVVDNDGVTKTIIYFTTIDDIEYEILSGLLSNDSEIMPQAKEQYQNMINKAKKDDLKIEQKIEKEMEKETPLPIIDDEPVETKTKTEKASISIGTEWLFKITDEKKIPREYLMVDEKKIKAVIKAGCRNIDGVLIYEQAKSSFRLKK
jgi:F0F1-type ATP synthase membrane subunit b/b'